MRNCELCGKEMVEHPRDRFPSQRARTRSRSCGVKLALAEGRGRQPTKRMCENCGEEIKGRSPRTCSRKCGVALAIKEGRWHQPNPANSWGESNTNWKGGVKWAGAYKMIRVPPGTPGSTLQGYMMEHRYVMQQTLGRALEKNEEVHHRNGQKSDNRPENLEVVAHTQHRGVVTCPHCRMQFTVR